MWVRIILFYAICSLEIESACDRWKISFFKDMWRVYDMQCSRKHKRREK